LEASFGLSSLEELHMAFQLINRNIEDACARKLLVDDNEHNCSGFVRAVADDQMLFIPGLSGNADSQVEFMELIGSIPRLFYFIGAGRSAELDAVSNASRGNFVIGGMTSGQLQKNRKTPVSHGHVAIIANGWGDSGWPLAWWGQKGGSPGKRESLSKCFRAADRELIKYFAYLV
jgi:hypothetical protein